ncbi:NAD-dependent epimerase/dehydratase family protein [Actinoplanes sp. TRM 88003]|uniref:NAD-dependent epimerase/dehydratase family protein n=1 Tax=Paractinoplanes aksuensis TaxID=2939490 RepID=A0ABT1DMD7_9ACTN|nr:NAD-dependent epimerase/dehydratase family protein [Actinoplanes aksuensis]MCO8271251.1 NAD-dependent epimerase/dehydratase family protein [Actinoplanes aksuensis]
MTAVLVTGGSGFIAGHCIDLLVEQGHDVRTTVRSLDRAPDLKGVSFHQADLLNDDGWAEAVRGVDYVLHVASPVAPGHVDNEDDLIVPAREGTLRVLRAARDAHVKRVVLTSAFHAVGWGHPHDDHVFTEADWTVLDGPGTDAYGRSKTLAERAAWDFAEKESLPLTTILPVAVMGPARGGAASGANHIVQLMLTGAMPAFPNLWIPIVDVRDVARAHVLAMTADGAAGERFLVADGPALPMARIGAILREHLGDLAGKVPTRELAEAPPALRADWGYARQVSSEKARRVLGWEPRPGAEAVVAAGRSLIEQGLVAG